MVACPLAAQWLDSSYAGHIVGLRQIRTLELSSYWPLCGFSVPHSSGKRIHPLRLAHQALSSPLAPSAEALRLIKSLFAGCWLAPQLHYGGIDGVGGIFCAWMVVGGETLVVAEGPTVVC